MNKSSKNSNDKTYEPYHSNSFQESLVSNITQSARLASLMNQHTKRRDETKNISDKVNVFKRKNLSINENISCARYFY